MEPIGFAFGVLGPLESLVRDLKRRFKNHKEAPGKLEEIRQRFQSCHGSLSSMKYMSEKGWPSGFPQESKEICENDLSRISDLAKSCEKQLQDLQHVQFSGVPAAGLWKQIIVKARRAARTNRVMEALQQLDDDSGKIETFTRNLNSLLAQTYQAANLAQPSTSAIDAFVPIFNIPRPSGFEVFDFSSKANPEGELKDVLLGDRSASEQVAAALGGAHPVSVPGILGMGGVGKTSALIGLGYDPDIRNRFSDGVHFLLFGQQVGPAEVIAGVAGLVRDSGGTQKAEDVASCSKLGEAVHKAALWFSNRTCLFLCDDLWRSHERPYGFLPDIKHLLDTSASSKMVISTRDRAIAGFSSHQVLFEPKLAEGQLALCIFLRHAGLSMNAVKACDDSAERLAMRVLAFCSGLPIALAVAGRLLRKYLQPNSNDPVNALRICLKQLDKGIAEIGDTSIDTYTSFYATIRASLDFIERDRSGRASSSSVQEEKTILYLFEVLCVMKNQSRLPISILHKLWDLSCNESILVIEKLVDLNIVAQHTDEFGAISISAHDLVLAFSTDLAERSGREKMWHRKLLNSYLDSGPEPARADCPAQGTSVPFLENPRPWWDVENDGYIHRNISWHLKKSGLGAELGGLVMDIRWAKHRVNEGGLLELENDIDVLLGTLANDEDWLGESRAPQETSKNILILRRSLRLSWSAVHQNPRELGFQLYSRLCHHKDSSEWMRKYLRSIEVWNERPWLRPWHSAETDIRLVTEIGVNKESPAAWSSDSKRILYANDDLVVFNVDRNEEECRTRLEHRITSMNVAEGGRFVALGSLRGTVHLWDLQTNSQVGETLKHYSRVNSVALSSNGRVLISGSNDRTVRLLQFDGSKVIRSRRKQFLHSVKAVSISENGKRAASASGKTVIVWETPRMKRVCKLQGHSRPVTCIAISADGQHLVSGSWDGSLRLWRLEECEKTGHPLFEGPHSVFGVSMSRDGLRVSALFSGGSARVLEMSTGKQLGPPFWVESPRLTYVALNGNGSHLILPTDQNVSIWDISEEVDERDRTGSYCFGVRCIAYNHETNRVASVSVPQTLKLWDADTGLAVGEPLSLSSDSFWPEHCAMSGNGKKIAVYFEHVSSSRGNIRVWDVHSRREIGKIRTAGSRGLWLSNDGEYVVSLSDVGKAGVWDVSTLAKVVRPRNESLRALKNGTDEIRKLGKERGLLALGTEELTEIAGNQHENSFKPVPSHSTAWKLDIHNQREIVFMNQDNDEFVLASLSEEVQDRAWLVYQNTRGENILVAGGRSGKAHWFTLEIE